VYSSYAYFLARGLDDIGWLQQINRYAPAPDLAVYLDVEPDLAIRRIVARDGHSEKREELDVDMMRRVRNNFLSTPWGISPSYHVLDGTRPPVELTEAIVALVRERQFRNLAVAPD
jgi:dTMP kinase